MRLWLADDLPRCVGERVRGRVGVRRLCNYTDAFAYLNSVDVQFAWDGVPLVVERTPNKRMKQLL